MRSTSCWRSSSLNCPRAKPSAPSALLSDQLFPLHKAVKRDHPPGDLRIVDTVVELRNDIQQVADNAAKLPGGLFGGNLRPRTRLRNATSCVRYHTAQAMRQQSALLAASRAGSSAA